MRPRQPLIGRDEDNVSEHDGPEVFRDPSIVGAVRLQSEMVKEATEFGRLPLVKPIRKAASESVPLQLLTLTVSI